MVSLIQRYTRKRYSFRCELPSAADTSVNQTLRWWLCVSTHEIKMGCQQYNDRYVCNILSSLVSVHQFQNNILWNHNKCCLQFLDTKHFICKFKSDPSIGYFSGEHVPLILWYYHFCCHVSICFTNHTTTACLVSYRILLFKCGHGNRLMTAINIFVDKFYSCYNILYWDGLDGGRDMRSFVSVHFFLRLLGNYLSVDEVLGN
jgi:hypothetical protein